MKNTTQSHRQPYSRSPSVAWIAVLAVFFLFSRPAAAYSPEDPEVQAMVDRGIAYLDGLSDEDMRAKNYGDPEGHPMIIAYAYLKATGDSSSKVVQAGIKNVEAYVKKIRSKRSHGHKATYEMAVAIMLMIELDAKGYADDIQYMADKLLAEQKNHGGYGYHGDPHGDTSQVQYVSLAMWTLDRAGFTIEYDRVGRLNQWIVLAQDPSGFWTYQPQVQPGARGLVTQQRKQLSMSTCLAAGSALLIGADVLRQWGETKGFQAKIEGLPKAVKETVEETEKDRREKARKEAIRAGADVIRASIGRFEGYRAQNPFKRTAAQDWFYYMLYTMERYESFIEVARPAQANNAWYDDGVATLMKTQAADGSWGTEQASWTAPPVSTAFAILFLIRSTKKSLAASSSAFAAGGRDLPSDTSKIVVSGTQIKGEPVAAAVTDLLDLLEDDDADAFDQKSIPEDLKLETDPTRRQQQLQRLERLVRGSQSWQARRVAARLLGASDDLSVVPALIYAVSDPDKLVREYAIDGLTFLSRRFESEKMSDKPTTQEIRKVQQQWRDWYQKIYPSYVFLDSDF